MANVQNLDSGTLNLERALSEPEIRAQLDRTPAERPASSDRDGVAAWVAFQHLATAVEITDVYYLPENSPAMEIRLLEVNQLVEREQDEVEAVDFAFDVEGLNYRLLVADLSPSEHERLRLRGLPLPDGWTLNQASHWGRR